MTLTMTEPAAELLTWVSDMADLYSQLSGRGQSASPPPLPKDCAGDCEDEALALLGLCLSCGVDLSNDQSPRLVAEALAPRVKIAAAQLIANFEDRLREARNRLLLLARQNIGPVVDPSVFDLHSDSLCPSPGEALLAPAALPEGHRLRDLLPRQQLLRGQWLAVGRWRSNGFGYRLPPLVTTLDAIKARTLAIGNGLDV